MIGLNLSSASKARHSEYLSSIPRGPDLSALLASGEFPFLLRCCLDGSGTGVQVATLNCLHSLLVSPPEEQLLDEQCNSFSGLSLPALSPHRGGKVGTLVQKTDMEVMKNDIIKVGVGGRKGAHHVEKAKKSKLRRLNTGTSTHATVAETTLPVGSLSASCFSESTVA